MLHGLGYSLQANVKTREGRQHPDRDAQFRHLAATVRRAQRRQQPTISVDTKKKELIGDFKNGGRIWRPTGRPDHVRVHDFVIPAPGHGKAIPYGVYDLQCDEGWGSVGIDHDTASFAVNAIRRWWHQMGRAAYPQARSLVVTATGPRCFLRPVVSDVYNGPAPTGGVARDVPDYECRHGSDWRVLDSAV